MVSTPTEIKRVIHSFVHALEPDIRVERVILYGSYAQNRPHEWSDIDVAVLSNDFERMSEIERVQFLARRTIHCDSRLVPTAYTPTQFENAKA